MNTVPVNWLCKSPLNDPAMRNSVFNMLEDGNWADLGVNAMNLTAEKRTSADRYWKRVACHPSEYPASTVAQLIVGQGLGNILYPTCKWVAKNAK